MILELWTNDDVSISSCALDSRFATRIKITINDNCAKMIIDELIEYYGEEIVREMVRSHG